MKRRIFAVAAMLLLASVAASVPAEEAMPDATDHAALATMYAGEAKTLRDKVASHELMLHRYENAAVTPKGAPFPKAALVQHCRNLVAAYKKAAADAETLAKMEQELAAANPTTK